MRGEWLYVVAVTKAEAQALFNGGLIHGRTDREAEAVLEEIRATADSFYAKQYKIFSFKSKAAGEQL
jgi:hypothetical protein